MYVIIFVKKNSEFCGVDLNNRKLDSVIFLGKV